jgi:hypothetical protein
MIIGYGRQQNVFNNLATTGDFDFDFGLKNGGKNASKPSIFHVFFHFSEIVFGQVVKIRQNKRTGPQSFLRDGLVLRGFYLENK